MREIQPFFLLDQDLLAGVGQKVQAFAEAVRRVWPQFLKMKTLMVGCGAGEGHLTGEDNAARGPQAEVLGGEHPHPDWRCSKRPGVIVLKEFPSEYRSALSCFRQYGFTCVPSMPMTRLDIANYSSFDDYLSKAIKAKRRTEFRRKVQAAEQAGGIELEVTSNAEGVIDEICVLYEQVYERPPQIRKADEILLAGNRGRMPDKARFFLSA